MYKCYSLGVLNFNPRSPCGERHYRQEIDVLNAADFNPRSPCGERLSRPGPLLTLLKFQSTLPVWGATYDIKNHSNKCNISIHAPRVGSDLVFHQFNACFQISIHAPRVGSDYPSGLPYNFIRISIHAPRVGSD